MYHQFRDEMEDLIRAIDRFDFPASVTVHLIGDVFKNRVDLFLFSRDWTEPRIVYLLTKWDSDEVKQVLTSAVGRHWAYCPLCKDLRGQPRPRRKRRDRPERSESQADPKPSSAHSPEINSRPKPKPTPRPRRREYQVEVSAILRFTRIGKPGRRKRPRKAVMGRAWSIAFAAGKIALRLVRLRRNPLVA